MHARLSFCFYEVPYKYKYPKFRRFHSANNSRSNCKMMMLLTSIAAFASTLSIPSTMQALVCRSELTNKSYASMDGWRATLPLPTLAPNSNDVLIQVAYASVNPCDIDLVKSDEAILATLLHKTLGFDVSGTIVAVGSAVSDRLNVGDAVWADLGEFGLGPTRKVVEMGAFAEFALADAGQVGVKPRGLSFAEAGVVPLVGLTNLEALNAAGAPWWDRTNVTLVITSGQGGTGHLAIQMAKALGADRIITAASTANLEWVRSLGADVVVDYTKESLWSALPNDSVDVVYDNFGAAGSADAAMTKLRSGGALVMIQGTLSAHPKAGTTQSKILCKANNYTRLDALSDMVAAGNLSVVRIFENKSWPLAQIGEAYDTLAAGHALGKVSVKVEGGGGGVPG